MGDDRQGQLVLDLIDRHAWWFLLTINSAPCAVGPQQELHPHSPRCVVCPCQHREREPPRRRRRVAEATAHDGFAT